MASSRAEHLQLHPESSQEKGGGGPQVLGPHVKRILCSAPERGGGGRQRKEGPSDGLHRFTGGQTAKHFTLMQLGWTLEKQHFSWTEVLTIRARGPSSAVGKRVQGNGIVSFPQLLLYFPIFICPLTLLPFSGRGGS